MHDASGPPNVRGRLVTRMKIGPLCLSVYAFADSEADVEDAGSAGENFYQHESRTVMESSHNVHSPPVPKPVMPRATVSIQNMPTMLVPLAPAQSARPSMIMLEVRIMATLRPR